MKYLSNPNNLPGFHVPEGFVRATRNGKTDIYVVLNQEPLGSYIVSVAYELDDFAEGRDCGEMLFLRDTDQVEHLGGIQEYLTPRSPADQWKYALIRGFDRSVGLLPIVRACENLRAIKRTPTDEQIQVASDEALANFHARRLMLRVRAGLADGKHPEHRS